MVAMTDHEMTKACATAMGLKPYVVDGYEQRSGESGLYMLNPEWHVEKYFYYDPLTVDAQAMALVKRFGMDCFIPAHVRERDYMEWVARCEKGERLFTASSLDLNRAIVRAVAEMQATLGDILKAEKP